MANNDYNKLTMLMIEGKLRADLISENSTTKLSALEHGELLKRDPSIADNIRYTVLGDLSTNAPIEKRKTPQMFWV